MKLKIILICFVSIFAFSVHAAVQYDSSTLLLKNTDQVVQMIQKKIQAAQKAQSRQEESEDGDIHAEPEAVDNLRDAMRIALSRPDQDGARANLYSRVRRELVDLNAIEQVLMELTEESIAELRNQDGPRRIATYVVILENMMAELEPDVAENPVYRKILERIRDAKLNLSSKARVQSLLRSMSIPVSPSVTAQKILKKHPAASEKPDPKKK